jgi:hypothetical protein
VIPLRRALGLFRLTLGVVVLGESIRTALRALGADGGHRNPHLLLLAGVEAIGAALFLFRPTRRAGAALMLLTFAIAFAFHAVHGEPNWTLLVFGAGVILILAEDRAEAARSVS